MPFWYSPDDASAFYSAPSLLQSVDFMRPRYFWLGVRVSCYVVLCAVAISLVGTYDGHCGFSWPGLSASPQPCSFWDHASFYLTLSVIGAIVYWPILLGILGILLILSLVGYWLDRRRRASV
jgi:hypothetical protein